MSFAIVAAGGLAGNRASPKTTADFYVLRNTAMPAVLIEHGFMDAPDDVPTILREDYAKAVGYAVAACIAARAGLAKKAQPAAPTASAVTAEQVQQIARMRLTQPGGRGRRIAGVYEKIRASAMVTMRGLSR